MTKRSATLFGIPPSRNRGDILREIEGETVQPNHIELEEYRVVWHTTPEEMTRLAGEFARKCRIAGRALYVASSGCMLDLCRSGKAYLEEWEPGVWLRGAEFAGRVRPEITIIISPSVLLQAAEKLPDAPWERKRAGRRYGADRRVLKFRIGDDIVTAFWTPEVDQQGVPQISPMQWAAWDAKKGRQYVAAVREDQMGPRRHHPLPPGFSNKPVQATAR
jgi:hypothetical protein